MVSEVDRRRTMRERYEKLVQKHGSGWQTSPPRFQAMILYVHLGDETWTPALQPDLKLNYSLTTHHSCHNCQSSSIRTEREPSEKSDLGGLRAGKAESIQKVGLRRSMLMCRLSSCDGCILRICSRPKNPKHRCQGCISQRPEARGQSPK